MWTDAAGNIMATKKVIHHRIFEVTATLLAMAAVAAVRSRLMPSGDEVISNVAAPLGAWLQRLQAQMPSASAAVWGVTVFFAGLSIGRYGVKNSLYPAYTLMSIPLFGAVAAMIAVSGDYLVTSLATLFMLMGSKYLMRCVMRTSSFGDLSLSMLFFGAVPLVFAPAAVVVYAVMPLMIIVVKTNLREWIVAAVSLLLPLLALCYVGWCCGGEFAAPVLRMADLLLTPSGFNFYRMLNPAVILQIGLLLVMVLCSVSLIISDRYSLKVKARAVMRFNALLLLAMTALFFLPSATVTLFPLVAVPAAILLPMMFVRMGVGFTEMLYRLLLLLCAAGNMVLMSL